MKLGIRAGEVFDALVFAYDPTIRREFGIEIDCATAEMICQPTDEEFSAEPLIEEMRNFIVVSLVS